MMIIMKCCTFMCAHIMVGKVLSLNPNLSIQLWRPLPEVSSNRSVPSPCTLHKAHSKRMAQKPVKVKYGMAKKTILFALP